VAVGVAVIGIIREFLLVVLIGGCAAFAFVLALIFLSIAFEFAVWVGKRVDRWYDKHYPVEK